MIDGTIAIMPHKKELILLFVLLKHALAVEITTKHGTIEGKTETIFNGKTIHSFLGIPYAAPPLGNYRFAPPQPLQSWNETLQATKVPYGCIQAVTNEEKRDLWYTSDLLESEDCLYLNLWVPVTTSGQLAVMIWIFGGGYFSGSANLPIYDGSILATEKNVIVVTVNYRLSLFGFLYLNSTDVPGNAGLQDQIEAIKWVNDNIESFGGDKNRITLFGESAGSVSIGFHLNNPRIETLFQNGIMESGSIDMTVMSSSEEKALSRAMELAGSVNCTYGVTRDILDCLRGSRGNTNCTFGVTKDILQCLRSRSIDELLKNYRRVPNHFLLEFPPVRNGIEVPMTTSKILVPGNKRKNIIGGNIPRELSHSFNYTFPGKILYDNTEISEDELRESLSSGFNLRDVTLQNMLLSVYNKYDGTYNQSQVRVEATDIYTDLAMICPQINFSKSWVSQSNQVYYFNFKHTPSTRTKGVLPKWIGATHGDEIPFVFGAPLDPKNAFTQNERELSMNIMSLWSNFAKSGDPNTAEKIGTTWPKVSSDGPFQYLEIDNALTVRRFLKERECDFWTNIFPGVLKIQDKLNRVRK